MKGLLGLLGLSFLLTFSGIAQDLPEGRAILTSPTTIADVRNVMNHNSLELYINKQSPVADDGTFTFLYDTNTEVSQSGNVRFNITADSKINVERYDASQDVGSEWVLIASIGSIETDYLNLIGTNPRIFTKTLEGITNYVRSTQSVPNGIDFGDMEAEMFLSSATIPKIIVKTELVTEIVQPDFSEIFTGTSVCNITTHTDYGKDIALKIKCNSPSGKIRVLVYADETKAKLLYASHSDWEFNENGEGYDLISGDNTIVLGVNPITFGGGTETCVGLESKGDLSIRGKTIDSEFKIYLERVVVNGKSFTVATQEYVTDNTIFGSENEVFEAYPETTAGYNWTDKIDITTAIKPAGKYRIAFHCEITESNNSQEVRFLVNGTTIHQHDTGNDELEPNVENYNWTPVPGLCYVTLTSPSTIDLNIQHKDSGTGKMSNAIIEIWRFN